MVVFIPNIVPNGKIIPLHKDIADFLNRKPLVWFYLIFFCDLLRKGKHGIHFSIRFAVFQLFTDCSCINIRVIITSLKA